MRQEIDPIIFEHLKSLIEADLAYAEKATSEAIRAMRAYLEKPGDDITGLRMVTMIDRANGLKRAYSHIETNLKRIQGDEE